MYKRQVLEVSKELELLRLGMPHNFIKNIDDYEGIMRFCIHHLMRCNELHLLDDWDESPGAIIEIQVAKLVGIFVKYPDYRRLEKTSFLIS